MTLASLDVPTEFEACKVNEVDAKAASGVPEITQVLGCTDAHDGSAMVPDLISQAVMAAPRLLSVVGITENAEPKVPVAPAYDSKGVLAATVKVTVASVESPMALDAMIVN